MLHLYCFQVDKLSVFLKCFLKNSNNSYELLWFVFVVIDLERSFQPKLHRTLLNFLLRLLQTIKILHFSLTTNVQGPHVYPGSPASWNGAVRKMDEPQGESWQLSLLLSNKRWCVTGDKVSWPLKNVVSFSHTLCSPGSAYQIIAIPLFLFLVLLLLFLLGSYLSSFVSKNQSVSTYIDEQGSFSPGFIEDLCKCGRKT